MFQVKRLLGYGAAAGPVYLVVGLAQVALRKGFDVRQHALSQLSNGDYGWIQIANFLTSGALVLAGAWGVRRLLAGERAGTWGPILLAGYGVGLIGAGIFIADPAPGFPPGTPMSNTPMTTHGLMHFVFGGLGFYSLIAACFVFARRFVGLGRTFWALYSAVTGLTFFCAFAAIASGSTSVAIMLTFYAAVAWVWVWHTALLMTLLRDS